MCAFPHGIPGVRGVEDDLPSFSGLALGLICVRKVVHTYGVWNVELQKVSPRPGRTTVALGLRVFGAPKRR